MSQLSMLLIGLTAGVVVPLLFVLVISGGRRYLAEWFLGVLVSVVAISLVNIAFPHLYWEDNPVATAVTQGLALALVQRLLVTIVVHGWEEERAAWFGFGFGILESLGVLLPLAPVYHDVLFQGHTLYQLYRKSLYSLFQAASAMVLAKASVPKLTALVLVQALGYALMFLDQWGVIDIASMVGNLAFLGVLLAPIYLRSWGEK